MFSNSATHAISWSLRNLLKTKFHICEDHVSFILPSGLAHIENSPRKRLCKASCPLQSLSKTRPCHPCPFLNCYLPSTPTRKSILYCITSYHRACSSWLYLQSDFIRKLLSYSFRFITHTPQKPLFFPFCTETYFTKLIPFFVLLPCHRKFLFNVSRVSTTLLGIGKREIT